MVGPVSLGLLLDLGGAAEIKVRKSDLAAIGDVHAGEELLSEERAVGNGSVDLHDTAGFIDADRATIATMDDEPA